MPLLFKRGVQMVHIVLQLGIFCFGVMFGIYVCN